METPSRPKGKVFITRRNSAQRTIKLLLGIPSKKRNHIDVQVKPMKLIVAQEEEEKERTKFDEIGKLQSVKVLPPMTVDQVCEQLTESENILALKNLKYDSLSNEDQDKLEETLINMLIKFTHTTMEVENGIPMGLYSKVDAKRKWVLTRRK